MMRTQGVHVKVDDFEQIRNHYSFYGAIERIYGFLCIYEEIGEFIGYLYVPIMLIELSV